MIGTLLGGAEAVVPEAALRLQSITYPVHSVIALQDRKVKSEADRDFPDKHALRPNDQTSAEDKLKELFSRLIRTIPSWISCGRLSPEFS